MWLVVSSLLRPPPGNRAALIRRQAKSNGQTPDHKPLRPHRSPPEKPRRRPPPPPARQAQASPTRKCATNRSCFPATICWGWISTRSASSTTSCGFDRPSRSASTANGARARPAWCSCCTTTWKRANRGTTQFVFFSAWRYKAADELWRALDSYHRAEALRSACRRDRASAAPPTATGFARYLAGSAAWGGEDGEPVDPYDRARPASRRHAVWRHLPRPQRPVATERSRR